jgi:hypothetical protein
MPEAVERACRQALPPWKMDYWWLKGKKRPLRKTVGLPTFAYF